MPCDTVTTQFMSEKLKNAMLPIIADAIKAMEGWRIIVQDENSIEARNGYDKLTWAKGVGMNITTRRQERADQITGEVTRSYSAAAVTWAAKRSGWTAQKTGQNTVVLTKR